MKYKINNKRGWIKIVEAFIAIILVAGIVLVVINQRQGEDEDISPRVHDSQTAILREIQLNSTLRAEIIGTSGTVEWDSASFPPQTKNKIENKTPSYLECTAKICDTSNLCLSAEQGKTIYAESVIITATINNYNPRKLQLFCSVK